MIKEDFAIQSEVRRMLVRANIDYTKIDFGTVRGVVYFRGIFQPVYLPSGNEEATKTFTAKTLLALEKKIRSIPGVSDVIFQFINWKKERGQWTSIQSVKREPQQTQPKQGPQEEKRKESDGEKDKDQTTSGVSANFKEG